MNVNAKRAAIVVAAVGSIGLLGTACSSNDDSAANSSTPAAASSENGGTGASDQNGAGSSKPTAIKTDTELTTADGQQVTISNEAIAESYGTRGGPDGYLGKPLGPVVKLKTGGEFITFENGSLYQNPKSGEVYAVHGKIGDEWGTLNHEEGRLGYPTSEESQADGGLKQTYDNGAITFVDGKVTVTPAG
ncbi:LGFP repeat-containing protein [Gordonia neofelifaecis]|uniref:LGFP repeat protein n=1 Tax=Gordonia neofelifaecis NRRL B-59395 TaxID=644548 RepID=F1YHD9_9ACTN|nr:LGFP repeat protein [Gordonia neofelifaecis]EGD55777.1 LGFP repeat protein [Gordonia neofelifaecis NRRL B-59395]